MATASQWTLPEWARLQSYLLAGPDKPAMTGAEIGNSSVSGGGMGLLDYEGFYNAGLAPFAGSTVGNGHSQWWMPGKYQEFNDYLRGSGNSLYEASGDGQIARWMQDAAGNVTAEPQILSTDDDQFGIAALLAGGVVTAGAAGAFGGAGAGGGAAAAGGATTGAAGASAGAGAAGAGAAEQIAFLAANGMTDAAIASAYPSLAAAGGLTGVGAGTAAGAGVGLMDTLKQGAGGLLEYAQKNPKAVGAVAGGLLGATDGLSEGASSAAPYTGPMPTISRGEWKPKAQAQMMAMPQPLAALDTTKGTANTGLWRYMQGK